MNIDFLIRQLTMAKSIHHGHNEAQFDEHINELLALKAKMLKTDNYGTWEATVYCISANDITDIVNHFMYDQYGRQMRVVGECTFEQFKGLVNKPPVYSIGLSDFTDAMLEPGYDVIKDLWIDNETEGNNKDDGTFDDETFVFDKLAVCPECKNRVPATAYCIDCGCDMNMTEEEVYDSLPHDPQHDEVEYGADF